MNRSPAPLGPTDRVLIVRLGAVGDVIRTLPALRRLRASYPEIHLAWIVEDPAHPLLEGHPDLDELILLPRRALRAAGARPWRLPRLVSDLRRTLRARRFGVALDFQGSFKSALVARLSGAPRRVGFARGHSREMSHLLMTERVRPAHAALNRVERNLLLAETVGARAGAATPRLPERPADGARAEAILGPPARGGGAPVVLSPGTSDLQAAKRWPAGRYGELAAALRADPGALPMVAWGPGEEVLAGAVVRASGGAAVLLPPTSLPVLASILRRAALFVGGDTGPMHLAWAVGCPVVALFGPTDPRLNAPVGEDHVVLRRGRAMDALPVEEVAAAARAALLRRAAKATP